MLKIWKTFLKTNEERVMKLFNLNTNEKFKEQFFQYKTHKIDSLRDFF
jgi:uncharacterized protein YcbK (DUF882 family)